MKPRNIFAILIIVLISLFACTNGYEYDPTPTPTPEPDIIPGEKIYELFIGDPFSTCITLYGRPDYMRCTTVSNMDVCEVNYFEPLWALVVLDENSNKNLEYSESIYMILTTIETNYNGTTAGGNGIGSSRSSIIEEYGPCEEPYSNETLCLYYSIGIHWYFHGNHESCDWISVFPPTNYPLLPHQLRYFETSPFFEGMDTG